VALPTLSHRGPTAVRLGRQRRRPAGSWDDRNESLPKVLLGKGRVVEFPKSHNVVAYYPEHNIYFFGKQNFDGCVDFQFNLFKKSDQLINDLNVEILDRRVPVNPP
jgi:hypothetical protein